MTGSEPATPIMMTIVERFGWIFAFTGALAVAGFIAGFFGPIVHHPASNQGPLAGIFITGPCGAVIGLVLGVILPFATSKPRRLITILAITTLVYGGGLWLAYAFSRDPGLGPPPGAQSPDQSN